MEIQINDPERVDELVEFLRAMGYVAQEEGGGTVNAFLPFAPQEAHARVDIALLLRSWQASSGAFAAVV